MKSHFGKSCSVLTTLFFLAPFPLWAQSGQGLGWGSLGLIAVAIIAILGAVVVVSENLLKVEAKRSGVDLQSRNKNPFAGLKRVFQGELPSYLKGQKLHILSKGHDIELHGAAVPPKEIEEIRTKTYSVQPPNYRGIRPIPKLEVEEGQTVKAGDPIFFDKGHPEIKYVSPVSGEFVELQRGAKRAITNLIILADSDEMTYREVPDFDLKKGSREDLKKHLMKYGGWSLLTKRPFDVVPDPEEDPKFIFISTFDTSPLAPDLNLAVEGREKEFQAGLDVLNQLTDGKVYLGLDGRKKTPPARAFIEATGVEKHFFRGAHPAGNVGVQMHHVNPIHTTDVVWTADVQNVITLGALFTQNKFMADRVVALTGHRVKNPTYIRAKVGADLNEILEDSLHDGDNRIINGNVLFGKKKGEKNMFLDARSQQITVIDEGDYYEPFGWLIPNKLKPSISKTYPNFLIPDLKFRADTNTHGEKRAFVVTGQYEQMLPMDIYLQHLMKAIMINDFERIEGLGIAELSEEDVALAEFACTSKMPLQKILREGLEYVESQL